MESARTVLSGLARFERVVTFAAFMVLIAVVFGDVAVREVSGTGVHWARQVGVYANLFVVMFGIGLASATGAHLRPRFADNWLPASWDPYLVRLQELLMAAFCLAFAIVAAGVVQETFVLQERSVVLRIIIWPFQAVIPLVFTIAAVRHALFSAWPELRPPEPTQADSQQAP